MNKAAELKWIAIARENVPFLYSDMSKDPERGTIGHLRGSFGSNGTEYEATWIDHQVILKSNAFLKEFDHVLRCLRKRGGLLRDLKSMCAYCYDEPFARIDGRSYAFQAETPERQYFLRCMPRSGDSNFVLYAMDKNARHEYAMTHLESHHITKETESIRS